MRRDSPLYTLLFAAAVCVVCSALVSSAAVLLRQQQALNKQLYKQQKVLIVAGLAGEDERLAGAEVIRRFQDRIVVRLVDLERGEFASGEGVPDAAAYDQRRATADSQSSVAAPANAAQIVRLPRYAAVYLVMEGEAPAKVVLPIQGKGLWSTLYGFLALERDVCTVAGITFYEHGETPGLGGEVDNPRWKARWQGRLAFDQKGEPKIQVIRGAAGSPEEDPYQVDGLSGATITSRGVSSMLGFWLGESGFGPFLTKLREEWRG